MMVRPISGGEKNEVRIIGVTEASYVVPIIFAYQCRTGNFASFTLDGSVLPRILASQLCT